MKLEQLPQDLTTIVGGSPEHSERARVKAKQRAELTRSFANKQYELQAHRKPPVAVCVFSDLAWVPTTAGVMTMREVYERAHEIEGFSNELNGFEHMSLIRLFASTTALMLRKNMDMLEEGKSFPKEHVDRLARIVKPYTNLFSLEFPFMQRPEGFRSVDGAKMHKPGRLYPNYQPDSVARFFDRAEESSVMGTAQATLALCVYNFYSPASNSRMTINGERHDKLRSNTPGIQFGRENGEFVEVMFGGENLYATMLRTTPENWVTGGGYPAWMDRDCAKTMKLERMEAPPIWYQTWGTNQAFCTWNQDGELEGVAVAGGYPLPPDANKVKPTEVDVIDPVTNEKTKKFHMERTPVERIFPYDRSVTDKAAETDYGLAATVAHRERRINDPFYLWSLKALPEGTKIPLKDRSVPVPPEGYEYKAHRPLMQGVRTETLAGWHSGGGVEAMDATRRRFVVQPNQYDYLHFVSHNFKGGTKSPGLTVSTVFREKPESWIPEGEDLRILRNSSEKIMEVAKALHKAWGPLPGENPDAKPFVSMQERTNKSFWTLVAAATREFIDKPQAVNTTSYWRLVRNSAEKAFDRSTTMLSKSAGVHMVEFRRRLLVNQLNKILENYL